MTDEARTDQHLDLSDALVVFLEHYPGNNHEEFAARFGTTDARERVGAILEETSRIRIEWGTKSLIEIGAEVEMTMHERHPELSPAALEKLSDYFTYLVR